MRSPKRRRELNLAVLAAPHRERTESSVWVEGLPTAGTQGTIVNGDGNHPDPDGDHHPAETRKIDNRNYPAREPLVGDVRAKKTRNAGETTIADAIHPPARTPECRPVGDCLIE